MDRQWQAVQKKTFTKWVNTKLATRNLPELNDVTSEFANGVALIQLLEIIGDESLGKYNKTPRMRIQQVENVNKALEFIKLRGVPLTNIGAEDIVDGNEKLVLGMIWIIILRFTISEISEGDLSAKEGLLLWCQRKTTGYKDVNVKDFTFSWQDGLAFCALIHRHRPDLIDFNQLNKSNKAENLEKAFEVAEKHLNIPRLLDVEDIADIAKPDERSVMTYVAQYFHAFSSADKVERSGRRVAKFSTVLQSIFDMKNDYESRVAALLVSISDLLAMWNKDAPGSSYSEAKSQLNELISFKNTTKRQWVSERRELDALLGNVQTKTKTYNLAPYSPPAGLTLADLEAHWSTLVEKESSRKLVLGNSIKEIKEKVRMAYAKLANDFQGELNALSVELGNLDGSLESQLSAVKQMITRAKELERCLAEVQHADAECQNANIDENDYTIYSVEDLIYDHGLISQALQKKAVFIENQITARSMTNVTPQQLEEFETTFHHFDSDQSNSLSSNEFRASMAGLGNFLEDEEFERIFKFVSQGKDSVSFEQFVSYMVSITEDTTSLDQLRESFKVLAGGKSHVTEKDLLSAQVDAGAVNFLTTKLPKKSGASDDAYDYNAFLDSLFNLHL